MGGLRNLFQHFVDCRNYIRGPRDVPRLALGLVFLSAAFLKFLDPLFLFLVVNQKHRFPFLEKPWIGYPVVVGLAAAEFAVGFCAFFGLKPKLTVVGAFVLNGLFVAFLAAHWGEILPLGCGCLGYPKEVPVNLQIFWKNGALLLLTLLAGFFAFRESKRPSGGETA